MAEILSVRDLTMRFGGVVALNRVGFDVRKGSVTALIGPNGAGKTTVFNCLTGFYRPDAGAMRLMGADGVPLDLMELMGRPFQGSDWVSPRSFARRLYCKMFGGAALAARAGVVRTFQNIRLFKEMTVMENLLVAQRARVDNRMVSGIFQSSGYRRAEAEALERAWYWLDFFRLSEDGNRLAKELAYGRQRRLEMARAMCAAPRLLCLDEPAAGLNPNETRELADWILALRRGHGVTVCLIEHDMGLVMEISDHVVVLDHGQVIASGRPERVRDDPVVLEAYLGAPEGAEEGV
ncbi:MAG: ATP-binding cassette domain-containing protein [Magnetococcales bacterium]|nr:ATP-binding cassette domain-containing protein [Magnetococcales bacterium]NGZ05669.1 ATP-binding cassette domain-containing protein [Magnetococcales bacterium]